MECDAFRPDTLSAAERLPDTDDGAYVVDCEPIEVSLPRLKVAPDFLAKIKQSHPMPLSAWGDLIDNSREAGATDFTIDVRSGPSANWSHASVQVVTTDNGCGMSESKMSEGLMGIGYTQKDLSTGQHYGFGSTTSIPRIADNALVFSINEAGERTVGFISSKLATQLGASELITPQCTWSMQPGGGYEVLRRDVTMYSLSYDSRLASLKVINDHSPFLSEAQLLAEFDRMMDDGAKTGTRVVMWNLSHEHNVHAEDDIGIRGLGTSAWAHQRSLRGYLELLYYCDDDHAPRMRMCIKSVPVIPRNWSQFLYHKHTDLHRPRSEESSGSLSERPTVQITFGYQVRLEHLVAVFSDRKAGKKRQGSENLQLQNYSGAFYYHRDRLIIPLKQFSCQQRTITQMLTTERRIKMLGFGLLAVCRENYLTAGHNKSHYVAPSLDEQKLPPAAQLFKTMSEKVRQRPPLASRSYTIFTCILPSSPQAERLLAQKIQPLLEVVMGKHAPSVEQLQSGPGGEVTSVSNAGSAEDRAAEAARIAREKHEEAEAARAIVPDAWMSARDGRSGRVVLSERRGWFLLRDHEGSVGARQYRARELTKETFDPVMHQQLPAPLAPMLGSTLEIWWRLDDEPSRFFEGTLVESVKKPGCFGHFLVWYAGLTKEDEDNEEVYLSIRPNGSGVMWRTSDGEMIPANEVRLDGDRLAAAAHVLYKSPGSSFIQIAAEQEHLGTLPPNVATADVPGSSSELSGTQDLVEKLQSEVYKSRVELKESQAARDQLQSELEAARTAQEAAQAKALRMELQQREYELAQKATREQLKATQAQEQWDRREKQRKRIEARRAMDVQRMEDEQADATSEQDRAHVEGVKQASSAVADQRATQSDAASGSSSDLGVAATQISVMSTASLQAREHELNQQLMAVRACLQQRTPKSLPPALSAPAALSETAKSPARDEATAAKPGTILPSPPTGSIREGTDSSDVSPHKPLSLPPLPELVPLLACARVEPASLTASAPDTTPASAPALAPSLAAVAQPQAPVPNAAQDRSPASESVTQPSSTSKTHSITSNEHASVSATLELRPGWIGRVRITWLTGRDRGTYDGTTLRWSSELAHRRGIEHVYEVKYDDGQQSWHRLGDPILRAQVIPASRSAGPTRGTRWAKLDVLCQLTRHRLSEPAKGAACLHLPSTNLEPLKEYVRKHRKCPVAGCDAPLTNARNVQVDEELQAQLTCVPTEAGTVWVDETGQISMDTPPLGKRPASATAGSENSDSCDAHPMGHSPWPKRLKQGEGSAEL